MLLRRQFLQLIGATAAVPSFSMRSASAATTSTTAIIRRDVMDMAENDPFFANYAKAVKAMHGLSNDPRSWVAQAHIHADHCHHGEIDFLHWHRHYLRYFEKICASLCGNPHFALPYWNWSKGSGRLPAPFFDLPELNVEHWNDPGRYDGAVWPGIDTVGKRGLDKTHGLLDNLAQGGVFTLDNIETIKGYPDSDTFWPSLEDGPHGVGHTITGAPRSGKAGHMSSGLSPLDPIFWLHHCMVDRIWAEWQQAGNITPDPKSNYDGNFCEADGSPAKADSSGAMDVAPLGYTYDILQSAPTRTLGDTQVFSSFSKAQINDIEKVLRPGATTTLGTSSNSQKSVPDRQTKISVDVPSLKDFAADLSALKNAGIVLGGQRVIARLSDMQRPKSNDLVVNVFVNCPYLTPSTPYSDPHYAGSFSFFTPVSMSKMPGMDSGSTSILIDITKAVRGMGMTADKIAVQLMPLSAGTGNKSESTFQVGKVEIFTI